ncbi:Acb2/Tad1 domain-containing protein [Streptomyces althioticus]|uniref:Acb2/Tad1 domain-containing protein n=1 Tax=Streptomyces althioticus TaxID=83380 RepID=UPI0033DFBE98
MSPDDIEHRFAFHAASRQEKRDEHTSARQGCRRLADHLNELLPEGREKALAITKLEEVMFWSNAAIARSVDD